jgi:ABC-2 type transport system ATP-binding protein
MIEISGFTFKYGTRVALDNINMTFKKGEITILAGANGAGKTTLLRAISGVLLCQPGKIRIDGVNVRTKSKQKTAYIPASLSFYDSLRIKDAIKLHSTFYKNFNYREIGGYRFNLNRKMGSLSRGEKTLFFLSLSLSTSPEYLLIDDVVHYLDPHLRDIFLQSILQLIEEQKLGLVIATQSPLDIEGIIDRVIVLDKGKTALDESVETLKRTFIKIYSSEAPDNLPVVFKKEYNGMKELYIYPYHGDIKIDNNIQYLDLSEILRAYIGGEYDRH